MSDTDAADLGDPGGSAGLSHALKAWVADLLGLFAAVGDLAASEARLAGHSLAVMLGLGGMLLVVAASTWFSLITAVVLWAFGVGGAWSAVFLTIALVNTLLIILAYWGIRRLSANLRFTELRAVLFEQRQRASNNAATAVKAPL